MITEELESIIRFMSDRHKLKVYRNRLDKKIIKPCVFYPIPKIESKYLSSSEYRNDYIWCIRFYDGVDKKVDKSIYDTVISIYTDIVENKNLIPIYYKEELTEDSITIQKVEIEELKNEVIVLRLHWTSFYQYERDTVDKIEKFNFDSDIKDN
ncbi:hypothetical protein [Dethiothermospora halolimnae]|uniref:hypothetical protein n=1 Tax=Dethiothermospora halolimnae TaxID=3114390 RepID=UPI003CCBF45D